MYFVASYFRAQLIHQGMPGPDTVLFAHQNRKEGCECHNTLKKDRRVCRYSYVSKVIWLGMGYSQFL